MNEIKYFINSPAAAAAAAAASDPIPGWPYGITASHCCCDHSHEPPPRRGPLTATTTPSPISGP